MVDFTQITEWEARIALLEHALKFAGNECRKKDEIIARLRGGSAEPQNYFRTISCPQEESPEAEAGAKVHYMREDFNWMLANGQRQEARELLTGLQADYMEHFGVMPEAAE